VFSTTLGLLAGEPVPDASDTKKPVFEEWVVVVMKGKPCGYGSTVTTRTDTANGPQYLTVHQEEFVVKRLGSDMKILETSKVTEDAEGGVLSAMATKWSLPAAARPSAFTCRA